MNQGINFAQWSSAQNDQFAAVSAKPEVIDDRPVFRVEVDRLLLNSRGINDRLMALLARLRIGPPEVEATPGLPIGATFSNVLHDAGSQLDKAHAAMNEIEGLL